MNFSFFFLVYAWISTFCFFNSAKSEKFVNVFFSFCKPFEFFCKKLKKNDFRSGFTKSFPRPKIAKKNKVFVFLVYCFLPGILYFWIKVFNIQSFKHSLTQWRRSLIVWPFLHGSRHSPQDDVLGFEEHLLRCLLVKPFLAISWIACSYICGNGRKMASRCFLVCKTCFLFLV